MQRLIKNRFIKRYWQDNSWALITGCTSGIGEQYALILAELGFNTILVSRNQEKLEKLSETIKTNYKTDTFILNFNFANDNLYKKENYNEITEILKDKNIKILINNVGQSVIGGYFNDYSIEDHKRLVNVNILSAIFFSQLFINLNKDNKNKKAVINISSFYGTRAVPGQAVYSLTKSALINFSESLDYESRINKNINLDVLCLTPLYVKTNMVRKKSSFFVLKPEELVISSLWQIGLLRTSYGNWRHYLHAFLYNTLPNKIFKQKMFTLYQAQFNRYKNRNKKSN